MAKAYAHEQPQGFSNYIERVTIVGAGGQMGKPIVEHLLKTGKHVVTAIARPNSTKELPEGVKVVRIDYSDDDDAALVDALREQQVLIVILAVAAPPGTIGKFIRAAAKAGVPYVLPNWFGFDPANSEPFKDSLARHNLDGMAEVERLGVSSYFLLTCGFWYEFSLGGGPGRYGFDFKKRSLVLFDNGNVAMNTSTWPQCGRAIAKLLSLKELPDNEMDQSPTLSQFRNSPIYISSFRLNQRDMFESVKRATGTADADWTITHESTERRWKDGLAAVEQGDMKAFVRTLYTRMFLPGGGGDHQSTRGLHNDVLGLPVEDLDEFTAVGIRMGENEEVSPAE